MTSNTYAALACLIRKSIDNTLLVVIIKQAAKLSASRESDLSAFRGGVMPFLKDVP
jgi:hypothetical protein